jgi:mono/diheme cytochrome c family protein
VRDVIARPDGLFVSRFKSAELIALDATGRMSSSVRPPNTQTFIVERTPDNSGQEFVTREMQPHLAWRAAALHTTQEVVMLHQSSMDGEIDIDSEPADFDGGGSSYGGGSDTFSGGCAGVVQTSIAMVDASMHARSVNLGGSVLSVDLAVSPQGDQIAIAQAGARDPAAPQPFVLQDQGDGDSVNFDSPPRPGGTVVDGAQVLIVDTGLMRDFSNDPLGCVPAQGVTVDGQATAVAYTPDGRLLVQTREPARPFVMARDLHFEAPTVVELGGASVADTGHDLFHRDSGGGIACASCHGEGGDDGHVWSFSGIGQRRTQAVNVGLEGTEPFHWDGDMRDLSHLMSEVFVGRMGGVHQSGEHMQALSGWLFALRPPKAMLDADDEAAQRGKHLFESSDVGCAGCHGGDALTNNDSVYVGTTPGEAPLQVPSLRGIAYRAPFIHTGCAPTLRERFTDPLCGGGDLHGKTSGLSELEIDDLVAYLKTL